jgi:hypothetical protein
MGGAGGFGSRGSTIGGAAGVGGVLGGSAAVGLGGARAQAAVAAALERLTSPPPTTPPPVVAAPPRWYERPWVWALAGVVVTSAVLLPFVFDSGAPDGFDVRPEGALPP